MSDLRQRKKPTQHPDSKFVENYSPPSLTRRLVRLLLLTAVFSLLSSKLMTDTWTWGYQGKWTNWRQWIPRSEIIMSEEELARHDGSNLELPIYVAVNGAVFDVTEGRSFYGKGGSYSFFAGKDAARAFTTGCFQTHLTHDLRGLTEDQLKQLDYWTGFFNNHAKYYYVGKVIHPPIDPDSPIPEDCHNSGKQKP